MANTAFVPNLTRPKILSLSKLSKKTAELINLCDGLKEKDARLASIAQTEYEAAAMWAVKAATA